MQQVGRKFITTHGFVHVGSLHKSPFVEQIFHIVINNDRSVDDFSRRRVYPRRAIGIFFGIGHISDARVSQVVGIKRWIVGGEVAHLHGIFESSLFESLVPTEHTFAQSGFPSLGEGRIEIINNGLYRFCEFAIEVSRSVLGHQAPTMCQIHTSHVVVIAIDVKLRRGEYAHTCIGNARCHFVFGQEEERISDIYRSGGIFHEIENIHN